MFIRTCILTLTLGATSAALAFPCFLTVVKDRCWAEYNVSVTVYNTKDDASLMTVVVPKGKSWMRKSFVCEHAQKLRFAASFTPNIWETDKGVVFAAKSYWTLPETIPLKDTAWEIPICYPDAFPGVPFPPRATGRCGCDFSVVTPIPPQK